MPSISTIGLDIAKSVFQVLGVDAAGRAVLRRQLRRRYILAFFQQLPRCLVGIEACLHLRCSDMSRCQSIVLYTHRNPHWRHDGLMDW